MTICCCSIFANLDKTCKICSQKCFLIFFLWSQAFLTDTYPTYIQIKTNLDIFCEFESNFFFFLDFVLFFKVQNISEIIFPG